ncbi:hypothetical protein ACEV9E_25890, partial [Vibrio parahaemolyticus]
MVQSVHCSLLRSNTVNKLTGALLIFMIFPAHVSANSCDIEGYTIGFFNGVATTLKGAKQGQKKIESTLG